jgi:hypothetical protein
VDNSATRSRPRPEARFAPDRRYTAVAGGGAIGALLALLSTGDAAGRLLFGVAAVLLAGYVAADLVFAPRLVATPVGLVINAPLTRARLSWADVDDVRAETRFRHGLRSTTLEIEAGPLLAVFSKRSLGMEPLEAAALVSAFRPR